MGRKLLLVAVVSILAVGMVLAASDRSSNRERGISVRTTTLTDIGTCQPETDASAQGWGTAVSGSYGGANKALFRLVWERGMPDVPDLKATGVVNYSGGRFAECTIPGVSGITPKEIVIHALEGLANDDFCVLIGSYRGPLLLGCHNETNVGSESWTDITFPMPALGCTGRDVRVIILATGNAWNGFTTYGQVAVDYITVRGQ